MEILGLIAPWLVVVMIAIVLGKTVVFSNGIITISSLKNKRALHDIMENCKNYYQRINLNNTYILRNQMTHAEGIIKEITNKCECPRYVYDYIILKVRSKFKENGLGTLNSEEFSRYVGSCIDLIRDIILESNPDAGPYVNSSDFSNKIASIFNEGLGTYNYYKDQNDRLERQLNERLEHIKNGKA